jgi:hypothetical protein
MLALSSVAARRALQLAASVACCAVALAQPIRAGAADGPQAPAAMPTATIRVTARGESIPLIRTARGLTTMISLPEEAREAICGDLYDAQENAGGFVIQRSGRDIFIKPLRAAGQTNLFIKTERVTYAFDLVVVAQSSAMRIVYVDDAAPERELEAVSFRLARERAELAAAHAAAAAELERVRTDTARDAREQAEKLALARIEDALAGSGLTRVARATARGNGLEIVLGAAMLTIGDRSFLPCTIRNLTTNPIVVATAELGGSAARPATLNTVVHPGSPRRIVAVFDGPLPPRARLCFYTPSHAPLLTLQPFD